MKKTKQAVQVAVRVEFIAVGAHTEKMLKTPSLQVEFALDGIVGDRHAGFVKKADGRDSGVKRGTIIRNWRQWSAVSMEELSKIAKAMSVDSIKPEWLGTNIAFSGCEKLTQIPKGSMIWFDSGVVLSVEGENAPCIGPGREIAHHLPQAAGASFPKAAKNLRGLVGVVYRPGKVSLGENATIVCYQPFEALPPPPR